VVCSYVISITAVFHYFYGTHKQSGGNIGKFTLIESIISSYNINKKVSSKLQAISLYHTIHVIGNSVLRERAALHHRRRVVEREKLEVNKCCFIRVC